MARHLKVRHARRGLIAGSLGLLLLSFQNCAPATQNTLCPEGQTCGAASESKVVRTPASTGGTGTGSTSGSGGFGPAGGVVSGGGTSGTGSGGFGGSTGSTGGTGGTGSGGTGAPGGVQIPTNNTFHFFKNLDTSVRIAEGAPLNLSVQIGNGVAPLTYTWYRNNQALSNLSGNASFYSDIADRYNKEGNYYVKVRDATGAEITSATANVYFVEPETGCSAGDYTMMAGNPMPEMDLGSLYENSRGKFLVSAGNRDIAPMMGYPGYWGISVYRFSAGNHLDKRSMVCSSYIPRFYDPRQYTNNNRYQTGVQYTSTGAITVECHNNKWKLIGNTCQWHSSNYNNGNNYGNDR